MPVTSKLVDSFSVVTAIHFSLSLTNVGLNEFFGADASQDVAAFVTRKPLDFASVPGS
jgi:hypothetical protein